ncbi:MAG: AraC family transcriptional regulator [Candidatus Didemnitutus sp.]|nr:AraC family transcriptional regulator [Candidatus Didemnitutus sp.]
MPAPQSSNLNQLVSRLPQPLHQLLGRPATTLLLPDNIVCFQRTSAQDLNRPRRGRALHHRFVLIYALRTAVTVCVDDQTIRLRAGEGLLVLPFQFHHYTKPDREELSWLFVTFELAEADAMAALRYRPFEMTPPLRVLAAELVAAYETESTAELPVLLLALLLARLRRLKSFTHPAPKTVAPATGLMMRVNQLAQRGGVYPGIKEIARALGISPSHLRARFKASCGVSIGRHLRRLRLEQACGLLRLGPQRVSEIAETCGFSSIYSLSRAFRMAYGVSPLAYRHSGRAAPGKRPRRVASPAKEA